MTKSFIDYMTEEKYARYNELLTIAEEAKKNAPKKERAKRGPLTIEQQIAQKQKQYEKAKATLERLLAEQAAQ